MTDDFQQANAALIADGFSPSDASSDLAELIDSSPAAASCGLVFHSNNGAYGIFRATRDTCVIVSNVRNGRIVSSGSFNLRRGQNLSILNNTDNRNYDGYRCC